MAQKLIKNVVPKIPKERSCPCANALSTALITDRDAVDPGMRKKLSILVDRYLT